jgi:RNA polymerase sigma-70 factor (ECF subfamily)
MRASAMRLTRNPADADDLVQDALLRAYRFWSSYRAGTHLSAWLNRIVKNTFINGYRRGRRERNALSNLRALADARREQARPVGPADAGFSDGVEAALQRITPEFRAVLLEVAVNELSYGEAAERLGCPVGTVMSRLHRARRALAPELDEYARAQGCAG